MAKLVLSMDGLVLKEIQLNKERLTIGRKPHNDIQIDNLAISGDHAAVVAVPRIVLREHLFAALQDGRHFVRLEACHAAGMVTRRALEHAHDLPQRALCRFATHQ